MKENVGTTDRTLRFVTGPALMALGYARWGGDEGNLGGLAAIVSGTMILESAITRVCPLNALFGIDTRDKTTVQRDLEDLIEKHAEELVATESSGLRIGR